MTSSQRSKHEFSQLKPLLVAIIALVPAAVCSAADYAISGTGLGEPEGTGINNLGHVLVGDAWYDSAPLPHHTGTLGGTSVDLYDINDSDQIAGASRIADTSLRAFFYDGTMHDLGTLGGPDSGGFGINNSGQVTGWARTGVGAVYHAFSYDGAMHDLGTLGGANSLGNSINSSGQIAGWAETAGGFRHAFMYDGTMHDLGHLGGFFSEAGAINDSGQIAGVSFPSGGGPEHLFLYDGLMHDLGTLASGRAADINNHGQIVGTAFINAEFHAILYDQAHGLVDLNSLIDPLAGWVLNNAEAINDLGQIVGSGLQNGEQRAFILTPVPEPSSLALAGIGLATGLLCLARKHRVVAGKRPIIRRASFALPLLAVFATAGAVPAFAEIKTYAFSGTYRQGEGFSVPLSDLLAGVEWGDPFLGTITYDPSAPSGDGQPLSISVLFDNEHRVTLHNTTIHSYINVLPPDSSGGDDSLAATVYMQGAPEPSFDSSPAVFVTWLSIDLFAAGNSTAWPMSVAELDLASSVFLRKHLTMQLHGPSLYPGDLGAEKNLMVMETIDSFTLVPEPGSLALAAVGSLGIGVVALHACRFGVAV